MKTVRRFDLSQISRIDKTEQGFVRVPAFVTKVGVFKYRKADGSVVREFRPPTEVFKKESMDSLKLIPVTNNHPKVLVNAANAKEHSIGFTGETVDKDDKYIKTLITVTDANGIADIESGKTQLSCGYEAELDETPGSWQGEDYDVVQKNIKYNHVALVDRGRAGPDVRLKLDSDDAILDDETNQGGMMEKIMIGGKEFECSPEMKAAIESELAKVAEMDAMKKDMDAAKAKEGEMKQGLEAEKAAKDAAQAKCDELEAELKKRTDSLSAEKIDELVQKRIKLLGTATKILGVEEKYDGVSDIEVMKKVITKKHDKLDLTGKSTEYIHARFDAIAEMVEGSEKTVENFGKNTHARNDGTVVDAAEARRKMIEESKNAWKQQMSATKK
jgi:hypothetical protein